MATRISDFYRGRTKVWSFVWKLDGTPVDITGFTITITFKKDKARPDATAAIQKVADLTDPTNGIATFTLTDTDTNVPVGKYCYDIVVVDTSGAVTQATQNTVNILEPVNNP